MTTIAQVAVELQGDITKLLKDAQKGGSDAGDAAGQSFAAKFGSAAASKALWAGFAAGAGIATAGLLQLDAATAKFRADTGATQADVAKMQSTVLGLNRSNLESIDELTSVNATLRTDLGYTQDQADATEQSFLNYAKATGQDAVGGTQALSQVLKAWNVDASDSTSVMDQLVASHQKYGGSIEDDQRALVALAPALQASNTSLDEAIGFLNLAAKSGIDASNATAALNHAVKDLKPGQSLDDLIKQISSIQDPTLRAQEAIKVFGARGGVQLSEALKPGVDSLSQFEVSASDAADATQKAADDIDSSLTNQVQLAIKNVGGLFIQLAAPAGPVLTGLGGMITAIKAAGLDDAFTSLWSKLAASPAIAGAIAGAGSLAGSAYGGALKAGTWITDALGVSWTAAGTAGAADATAAGTEDGAAYAGGAKAAITAATGGLGLAGLLTGALAAGGTGLGIGIGLDWLDQNVFHGDQMRQQARDEANKTASEFFSAWGESFATQEKLNEAQTGAFIQQLLKPLTDATAAYTASQNSAAGATRDAGYEVDNANPIWSKFLHVITNGTSYFDQFTTAAGNTGAGLDSVNQRAQATAAGLDTSVHAGIASLQQLPAAATKVGVDTLDNLAKGINDERQKPVDEMNALVTALKTPLSQTAETTRLLGELASKALVEGLQSGDPAIRAQADATRQSIIDRLNQLTPDAGTIGKKGMQELASALKSEDPAIRAAAQEIELQIQRGLAPIATDAKLWGQKTGDAWVLGVTNSIKGGQTEIIGALAVAKGPLEAHSPPGPLSPLHLIDVWGKNTGLAWVQGLVQGLEQGPDAAKLTLSKVQSAFTDAVNNYGGVGSLIPAATPAAQSEALKGYIANLEDELKKTYDPQQRLQLEQQIADYTNRLNSLVGQASTSNEQAIDALRGYIDNLDKALLTETDPQKYQDLLNKLIDYSNRITAIQAQTNAASAAVTSTAAPTVPSLTDLTTAPAMNAPGVPVVPVTNGGIGSLRNDPSFYDQFGSHSTPAPISVTINNPAPEPASTSVKNRLQTMAAFGVLG